MRVTGETFTFILKRKKNQEGKMLKILKLSGKKTVTRQNSGELFIKGWILKLWT